MHSQVMFQIFFFREPSTGIPHIIALSNIIYILVSLNPALKPSIKSILAGRHFFEIPFLGELSIRVAHLMHEMYSEEHIPHSSPIRL